MASTEGESMPESLLPQGLVARPATMDDIEAALELANACSIEQIGKPKSSLDQFRTDWQSPYLRPENDLWVVSAPDARLVGYAGVWDTEPHVQMFGWGHVHPGKTLKVSSDSYRHL